MYPGFSLADCPDLKVSFLVFGLWSGFPFIMSERNANRIAPPLQAADGRKGEWANGRPGGRTNSRGRSLKPMAYSGYRTAPHRTATHRAVRVCACASCRRTNATTFHARRTTWEIAFSGPTRRVAEVKASCRYPSIRMTSMYCINGGGEAKKEGKEGDLAITRVRLPGWGNSEPCACKYCTHTPCVGDYCAFASREQTPNAQSRHTPKRTSACARARAGARQCARQYASEVKQSRYKTVSIRECGQSV